MARTHVIPARTGHAVKLDAGQCVKVINTHGSQVVDTWALNAGDPSEYLSMEQTRRMLFKLGPGEGDTLYSNRRNDMLVLDEDTAGVPHDTLIAACDEWVYEKYGFPPGHASCQENFRRALDGIGVEPPAIVPNPLNLWMNVPVSDNSRIALEAPLSGPGDHVTFRALIDVVMVFSACPADVLKVNGEDCTPKDVAVELLDVRAGS
ncbi:MAG: DUF1989 domain-containing protein [Hyphomicrobiales bacterium]